MRAPVLALLKGLSDGRLRLLYGARRTVGCQRAGKCRGDHHRARTVIPKRPAGPASSTSSPIRPAPGTENDRAAATLALFDMECMSVAGIAKATGRPKTEVEATLTVARSQAASQAADWGLTLDQAATLAEFDEDPGALAVLAKTAETDPAQFGHVAQQLRDSAAERAQKAELVAELEAAGYQVTDNRQDANRNRWHNLRNWLAADGGALVGGNHGDCPYRAVRIEQDQVWPADAEAAWRADPANADYIAELREADGLGPDEDPGIEFDDEEVAAAAGWVTRWVTSQHYCTDPEAAGHKDRYPAWAGQRTSSQPKPEPGSEAAEKAKAERRRVLAGNKAWRSATTERTRHLKGVLSRKSLTPKVLADAAALLIGEAIARGEAAPEKTGEGHALACRLLGLSAADGYGGRDLVREALLVASPARRLVITLGMILAAAEGEEGTWGCCADVKTWQNAAGAASYNRDSRAGRYLAWLEQHTGYPMTDLEKLVAHGTPIPGPAVPAADVDVAPPAAELDTGTGVEPPAACTLCGTPIDANGLCRDGHNDLDRVDTKCTGEPGETCTDADCPVHYRDNEDPKETGPYDDDDSAAARAEAADG